MTANKNASFFLSLDGNEYFVSCKGKQNQLGMHASIKLLSNTNTWGYSDTQIQRYQQNKISSLPCFEFISLSNYMYYQIICIDTDIILPNLNLQIMSFWFTRPYMWTLKFICTFTLCWNKLSFL